MTDDTRALLETIQRQATELHHHREANTTMIHDYDHDDHDHGPPLDPATRNAVYDAGQAALGRRQSGALAERLRVCEVDRQALRGALDATCAELAAVTAAMDTPQEADHA